MIGFDVSTTPLEKNIELTRQAVEAVKSINQRGIVEGVLGFIGSGSEIHESVSESSRLLTKTDDAKRFVEATQIDVLAPLVGNMHGLLKSMISGSVRKRLDIAPIWASVSRRHWPRIQTKLSLQNLQQISLGHRGGRHPVSEK